jgi:hypothetical protein
VGAMSTGYYAAMARDRQGRAGGGGLSVGRYGWILSGVNRRWGSERRTPMENFGVGHVAQLRCYLLDIAREETVGIQSFICDISLN